MREVLAIAGAPARREFAGAADLLAAMGELRDRFDPPGREGRRIHAYTFNELERTGHRRMQLLKRLNRHHA